MGSTMMYVVVVAIVVLLVAPTQAQCPSGCTCSGKRVQCTDIQNVGDVAAGTKFLDLSNNSIGERVKLTTDSFTSLTNLKTLILSDNQLKRLPQGLFNNLKSLHTLNLSKSHLGEETTLRANTFTSLTSLHTLILSHNQLEWFHGGLFENLKSLRTLDINHNPLQCDCDLVAMMNPLRERMSIIESGCWLQASKLPILTLNCSQLPDDCHLDNRKCHKYAKCEMNVDDEGDYSLCTCREGFEGNGIQCEDINECDDHESTKCHMKAQCINTLGSYRCRCGPFYTGDGTDCKDIDDCLQADRCKPEEICENVDGGFNCNCPDGFTKASIHPDSRCRDLNECTETSKCSKLVNCTNTVGSYHCSGCPDGYVGDGHYCNVACGVSKCISGSKCVDTRSGALCRCPFGMYVRDTACVMAADIIKVQHMEVKKYYTRGLRRFNSPAFLEFARHIEPILLRHLRSNFSSIVNVQVVRIVRSDVRSVSFVDFVVLVDEKSEVLSGEVEVTMYEGIKKGKVDGVHAESIQQLDVKYTNMCDLGLYRCRRHFTCVPTTKFSYKCECKEGYLLKHGRCVRNRIVRNVVIAVLVIAFVLALFVGIFYLRKKKNKCEKPLSMKEQKMTNFNNPAYSGEFEETTSL